MNRLKRLGKPASHAALFPVPLEWTRPATALQAEAPEPSTEVAFYVPLHYERNYAYPLLVWLHGPQDDERQIQVVAPEISLRNYVGVGVRGNTLSPGGRCGYGWNLQRNDSRAVEDRVFDAIDEAQARYNISRRRIFLAGLEEGGSLAFRIAAENPGRFAGVLSIGGGFPTQEIPQPPLHHLRRVPLFLAHGRDSLVYPEERLCEDLKLLHSAGLQITVRQYLCGDDLHSQTLRDMDAWMMEIVTGTPSQANPLPLALPSPGEN